ncbi:MULTISPECIES: putative FMN-dependent luciferase-like monooxygenase [unclassified Tatumella]|uniref:putative FMN-dependent luciferase-like monooxygenase n=1 Tax=unclassified Tatumella TaxID=2649542 RepID=UPI001BB0C0EC|nr:MULTISPECIES: putative FMN-dependent luciferase-like monooxygenase [unclassified Tatumella]MBS0877773.1 putative FMN-dependent luciferase-like monooxygenase [Tatumella sp. JGM82]MBS0891438.1 putative FMN-dependent luciferase-like monooxygenase [Tatumella sp. JGM94]MBS0902408.1 putative FMN-dependent luciferase-like monooxygenase [Tatumella sp. JGM100]
MTAKRIGFFTRLLEKAPAGERYRLATEQVCHAEALGFDSAWVAQHHFHEHEGGLPSPLLFLAHAGAHTRKIRLGTAIITLPMENAIRVAEDAAVLDLLIGGRLELGLGSGGTPGSFEPFGQTFDQRAETFAANLAVLQQGLRGAPLQQTANCLYPAAPQLIDKLWIATFSAEGAERAGKAGLGLMLSRTQPRPAGQPGLALDELQNPLIDAYLAALPAGTEPRILASRTAFVADDRQYARKIALPGLTAQAEGYRQSGHQLRGETLDDYIGQFDAHIGDPPDVLASLLRDSCLSRVTDISFQVHSVEPEHGDVLRSLELLSRYITPVLRNTAPESLPERSL